MKTRLLLLICLAGFITSQSLSQITIDSTDMPSIGDTCVMATDTAAPIGLMVGGIGAQSWDFTNVQIDELDTLRYVDPASTPFSLDFPGSNLAIEGVQPIVYQTLNGSSLITDGYAGDDPFGAGLTISAPFNPSQKVIDLPSTDGSMFSDSSAFDQIIGTASLGLPVPNVDSIRMVHNSWATSVFDAFGTVDLPGGSYNTIRQLYTENTIDSVFAYCSDPAGCNVFIATLPFGWSFVPSQITDLIVGIPNPAYDTTYTYKWWANAEDVPVVEVETEGIGGTALSAQFKVGNSVIAMAGGTTDALCKDSCEGIATVIGLSGSGSYSYVWDDPGAQTTATATGLCAGTHTAYIVDGIDTSGSVSFTIGEPTAILIILTTTSSPNDSDGIATALVSGGTGPYFYLWNTTPAQLTASAINLVPGTYSITVTDDNGCIMTGTTDVPVGINDLGKAGNFIKLYPTPAKNNLFVNVEFGQDALFIAYNILGEKALNITLNDEINEINISDLSNGVYVFQMLDLKGKLLSTGKFSIER